jgi:ABC-type multidrug transport system fused ATPase/permease subunit
MSGWFEQLFGIQLKERTRWLKRVERKNYLANVVDGLLVFIRDGAAYSYLIYLTLKGSISVADFTLYFGTVAGFSTWLSGITNEITQLSHLSLDISDVRDYLDLPERKGIGSECVSSSALSLPCEIELEHVTFQYPGSNRKILYDLNLTIQPSEKVALVGVNGAGKSTLVKLLCGLYQPHSGKVLVNGNNSLDYNPDQIFKLFGVVFQEIHVLPVSIARNIATDCNVPVNVERVMECLRLAGLEEKVLSLPQGIETPLVKEVNEAAIQFSGGELQKLLLARSLYKDAPILILDEPTAALDPISENELYLRYNDLTANKTSVFISHRLTSTRFCDRIVFLSDGNIAETGTHEELMELNGQYAKMYKIQSHYYQERIDEMDGGGLLHEFQ